MLRVGYREWCAKGGGTGNGVLRVGYREWCAKGGVQGMVC